MFTMEFTKGETDSNKNQTQQFEKNTHRMNSNDGLNSYRIKKQSIDIQKIIEKYNDLEKHD